MKSKANTYWVVIISLFLAYLFKLMQLFLIIHTL